MKLERYSLKINGIVQGVGFRPFVYTLAKSLFLNGWVKNAGDGLYVEVEGTEDVLRDFLSRVKAEAPPLAHIRNIAFDRLPFKGYKDFSIIPSTEGSVKNTFISPDIATCDDCKRELFDREDYRYLYPFINCTNCGPRFTIIKEVPYDRHNTTMEHFPVCNICKDQYNDVHDRRYHAQPVSCHNCGPRLLLLDKNGTKVEQDNIIAVAADLLAKGNILAIKGLGGYHLACDAYNKQVLTELRKRKNRDEKPFALMTEDIATALKHCFINDMEKSLIDSIRKPIVLLEKRSDCLLPEEISPGNPYLGIMLPYTPLHCLLFNRNSIPGLLQCPDTLVMTSGNKSSEPICFKDEAAMKELKGIADYFLLNDREVHIRTDDSVTRMFSDKEFIIRRSRGYVPMPISINLPWLTGKIPSALACGGELKNTFCLNKGNDFYLSHHIGDLENLETLQSFEEGVEHFKGLFDIKPEVIVYDLHPEYLSTKFAYSLSYDKDSKVGIQHHKAHIASCMAENGLTGDVIGVALDGTGYGEDGNIWGGEFFYGSYGCFTRAGHLEYVKMPGGETAIREPWRMAISYLSKAAEQGKCSNSIIDINSNYLSNIANIPKPHLKAVENMMKSNFNSPLTSSMGRLYDAVSALAGIRSYCNYEGQAAIELEYAAIKEGSKCDKHKGADYKGESCKGQYAYTINKKEGLYKINVLDIISGVVDDKANNVPAGVISEKFHETIATIVNDTCCSIALDTGFDRVVLSGGVFQNMLLLKKCVQKLNNSNLMVFIHSQVPSNDGGIALGQAVIAIAKHMKI